MPAKGHHLSEKTRAKMAEATRQHWRDPSIRLAMSIGISTAKKGCPGHPHTDAHKAAASVWMRRAHATSEKRRQATVTFVALAASRRGSSLSPARRQCISLSLKRAYATGLHRRMSPEEIKTLARAGTMAACRKAKPSRLEQATWIVLDKLGVVYQTAVAFGPYVADIYVAPNRLVIECDGAYWHKQPTTIERDARRDNYMRNLGLMVLRLPEKDIKTGRSVTIMRDAIGLVNQ